MIDFFEILSEYVKTVAPDYKLISETPSGINVDADSNTFQKLMWVNTLENGNIETVNSGLNTMITRNVSITLFTNCVKEDDGIVYEMLKKELMDDGILLYNWLVDKLDINQISYDTGVDRLDQNMVAFQMNFVFEERLEKCDYFESLKNKGIGLFYYNTYFIDKDNHKVANLLTYMEGEGDPNYEYLNNFYNFEKNDDVYSIKGLKEEINDEWLYKNLRLFKVCDEATICTYGLPLFIIPNNSDIELEEIYGGLNSSRGQYKIYRTIDIPSFIGEFKGTNYTLLYMKFKPEMTSSEILFYRVPKSYVIETGEEKLDDYNTSFFMEFIFKRK